MTVKELRHTIEEQAVDVRDQTQIRPSRLMSLMTRFQLAHLGADLDTLDCNMQGSRPTFEDETGRLQVGLRINPNLVYLKGLFAIMGVEECGDMQGSVTTRNGSKVRAAGEIWSDGGEPEEFGMTHNGVITLTNFVCEKLDEKGFFPMEPAKLPAPPALKSPSAALMDLLIMQAFDSSRIGL